MENKFSDLREEEIERRLKQLNKPAVKSFHLPNGDIIDCVRIMDQPAFDNPLLKNHKLQMRPSSFPTRNEAQLGASNFSPKDEDAFLTFKCKKYPKFTVPIMRTTREDLLTREKCVKKTAPPR